MDEPRISLLDATHSLDRFDCGVAPLNRFLKELARPNSRRDVCRVYVLTQGNESNALAYSAVSAGTISREALAEAHRVGMPRYPLPTLHLGRLAVDLSCQGRRFGERLMMHFFDMAIDVSERIGLMAADVIAKTEAVAAYYLRLGFVRASDNPLHLYIPLATVRTLRRIVGDAGTSP